MDEYTLPTIPTLSSHRADRDEIEQEGRKKEIKLWLCSAENILAGYPSVSDANATGMSNSDHPATRGMLYRTEFPAGQRITQDGQPTSNIGRLYHSVAGLTPKG